MVAERLGVIEEELVAAAVAPLVAVAVAEPAAVAFAELFAFVVAAAAGVATELHVFAAALPAVLEPDSASALLRALAHCGRLQAVG